MVTTTVAGADLAVTKTVDKVAPFEGDTIIYTVKVTNNGPDTASSVVISDTLPTGLVNISHDGGGSYSSGAWTIGNLANGGSQTLKITATVNFGMAGTTITNTAVISTVSPGDPTATNNSQSATLTVQQPDLAFNPASYSVAENGGSVLITVRLNHTSTNTVAVNYATSNGSASGTLTFLTNTTQQTFTVTIIDDALYEGNEAVNLTLSNPVNGQIVGGSATLTIVDNDAAPTVGFSAASYTVPENGGSANITVVLNTNSGLPVSVNYSTSNGTATAGSDYIAVVGTLTIPAGATSASFTIPISDDTVFEGDETVQLTLLVVSGANLGLSNVTLTIGDNELPSVQFSAPTYSMAENGGSAVITVTLSAAFVSSVSVNYRTINGTAMSPSDYSAVNGTLTFAPAITRMTFTVPIINDAIQELTETVGLSLFNVSINALLGSTNPATLTIGDDDTPTLDFSASAYTVNEGAGQAVITVTLNKTPGLTVSVNYQTQNGTAVGGVDYTSRNGILTFSPGVTVQTFTVPINDDLLDEVDETLTLSLQNVVNALNIHNQATLTLVDNDLPPTVNLSAAGYQVNENTGTATITITLSAASSLPVTVTYRTVDGTAIAGQDYVASNGLLLFTPGITQLTSAVSIIDDLLNEGIESLIITLTNSTNATFGIAKAELTIIDTTPIDAPIIGLRAFNNSPTSLGQSTTLSATIVSGDHVTYTWAFGDGIIVSQQTAIVKHTYLTVGVYTAVVTVNNKVSLLTATTLVTVERPINGLFAFNDGPTLLGQPTMLSATVTAGSNVVYTWRLGDGTMGVGAVITHSYLPGGWYTAIVTASNAVSLLTATTTVIVQQPITGLLVVSDSPTMPGQPTTFTATVISGLDINYRWAFSDGTGGQGSVISHTYAAPGIYEVVVTASNQVSEITATMTVVVTEIPILLVDLSVAKYDLPSPAVLNEPLTYTLIITNNGPEIANGIVLTDILPSGMLVASTSSNCQGMGIITCAVDELPVGTPATVTMIVTPTSVGWFTNTAHVMAAQTDLITTNNMAIATTAVGHARTTLEPIPSGVRPLAYTNSQGNLTMITLPAGVVTEPIVLLYTELEGVDSIPDGFEFANHAFKLEFYQAGRLLTNYAITVPLTVTIGDGNLSNLSDLVLMIWNGSQWSDVTSTCHSPIQRKLVFAVSDQLTTTICQAPGHFALFSKSVKLPKIYLPIILRQPTFLTPTPIQTSIPTPTPTLTPTPTQIPLPDLVGSLSLVPDKTTFTVNETVLIKVVVTNQGNAPSGAFWVDFFINPNPHPTDSNSIWSEVCGLTPCYGLAWHDLNGLQPGESITLTSADNYSTVHSIWPGHFASGTTDLYVYIDTWSPTHGLDGAVIESNEANNLAELHGLTVTGTETRQIVLPSLEELKER